MLILDTPEACWLSGSAVARWPTVIELSDMATDTDTNRRKRNHSSRSKEGIPHHALRWCHQHKLDSQMLTKAMSSKCNGLRYTLKPLWSSQQVSILYCSGRHRAWFLRTCTSFGHIVLVRTGAISYGSSYADGEASCVLHAISQSSAAGHAAAIARNSIR